MAELTFETMSWAGWIPKWKATLLFVQRENGDLLMIEKKRGLGAGKINAPGGRLEPGETPLQAAIREVQEEVCVTPHAPSERGYLQFQFTDGLSIEGGVFTATSFEGVPAETPEARPLWIAPADMPYDRMWADDRIWLPHLLAGKNFRGRFLFNGDKMLGHALTLLPLGAPPRI